MKRLALIAALAGGPAFADSQPVPLKHSAERWGECAEMRDTLMAWDNGASDKVFRKYGDLAVDIVRSARFVLHMRIEASDQPNGFRFYCPPEFHIE